MRRYHHFARHAQHPQHVVGVRHRVQVLALPRANRAPQDLLELRVIDEIIPEPPGGAHADPDAAAQALGDSLRRHVRLLRKTKMEKLLKRREEKYLSMGALSEK